MYIPALYLALIIGGWLIDSAAKKRRKAAKRAAKVVAVRTARAPQLMPVLPPQPTVWGPDKPWKTEAQYRNAVQVAQWDKAQRQSA